MKAFKFITIASFSLAVWFNPDVANAEEWKPTKPVEFAVGAGPGGSLDQVARTLKHIMDQQEGAPELIVINKPGGGGRVAVNSLKQNAGDPHFVASWSQQWLTNYILGDWDESPTEYATLAMLFREYVDLAVRADSPLKNVNDLVQKLKADPTSVTIAVATAIGNHIHIGAAKPLRAAGVDVSKLTIVPYKSSAESIVSALGGHVDVVAATTPSLVGQLAGGKIRLLAISSPERLGGVFADTPTWKEQGIDADFSSHQGIMAAQKLTPEQIAYWEKVLKQATDTQEWKDFVARNQWTESFISGKDADAFALSEQDEMRAILTELGLAKQ